MTKQEHTELINQIKNATTDVERNNHLATLINDYDVMLATASENSTRIAELEKDNVEFAKLNNKLFLQIGTPNLNDPPQSDPPQSDPPPKRSYEDLVF